MSKNTPAPVNSPFKITLSLIYGALKEILPLHAEIIISCIKKVVIISDENSPVKTIAINRQGYLIIYQPFWDEHVTSVDTLKFLLYHELLHHISGDVYTFKTPQEGEEKPTAEELHEIKMANYADNIAMDSRINAFITQTRPDIGSKFAKNFYSPKPPAPGAPPAPNNPLDWFNKLLMPESDITENADAREQYENFYSTYDFCQHYDLASIVLEELRKQPKSKANAGMKIILLGGHGDGEGSEKLSKEDLENAIVIDTNSDKSIEEQLDEQDVSEAIKEAVIDHLSDQACSGAGNSKELTTKFLNEATGVTQKFDLTKFKKMMFNAVFHNVRSQARVREGKYGQAPYVPTRLSISDMILSTEGIYPVLWKKMKMVTRFDKELLPIYLDVSGSTWSHLPQIIKLISNVNSSLDYVWGFSNEVHRHTMKDLKENKIKSTGGTDFDCVIDHAVANKFKHIVLITDGDAYTKYSDKVPGIESAVIVLFGYARKDNYFSKVYKTTKTIDEVTI